MLCKELGIDDPISWFQNAPEAVVDSWLAYYSVEQEVASGEAEMTDPMTALKKLQDRQGVVNAR